MPLMALVCPGCSYSEPCGEPGQERCHRVDGPLGARAHSGGRAALQGRARPSAVSCRDGWWDPPWLGPLGIVLGWCPPLSTMEPRIRLQGECSTQGGAWLDRKSGCHSLQVDTRQGAITQSPVQRELVPCSHGDLGGGKKRDKRARGPAERPGVPNSHCSGCCTEVGLLGEGQHPHGGQVCSKG